MFQIVFAGDDTWLTIFSSLSRSSGNVTTFPYDSFNVEDLHSVDEGVISHLIPALTSSNSNDTDWDVLIGHMLGVDHVGHRLSPSHLSMRQKLLQMDGLLRNQVVPHLKKGDLLVVLGDHGMSSGGDHGGDSIHETSSALWIYSTVPIPSNVNNEASVRPTTLFPGHKIAYRSINQIDLLPTLSILLGLPIPFNNLGSIIPEFFSKSTSLLERVININALQVNTFLHSYRASKSGRELDKSWDTLSSRYASASASPELADRWTWMRIVLEECRSLWAQFDFTLMGLGLVVLLFSLLTSVAIYKPSHTNNSVRSELMPAIKVISIAAILGVAAGWISSMYGGPSYFAWMLTSITLSSMVHTLLSKVKIFSLPSLKVLFMMFPLILHALSMASNSFTVWEDHIIPFLFLTILAPSALIGISSPTKALRCTILWRLLAIGLLTRAMGWFGRVCREEQMHCSPSFYLHPILSIIGSLVMAIMLPWYIPNYVLGKSKSNGVSVRVFMSMVLRPALIAGSIMWTIEHLESSNLQLPTSLPVSLRTIRTVLAWYAFPLLSMVGILLWTSFPLALTITREEEQKRVTILGFANASGAAYYVFLFIPLIGTWISSPPMGQIVLGFSILIIGCLVEIWDAERDVQRLHASVRFARSEAVSEPDTKVEQDLVSFGRHIAPLMLLAFHTFFSTGHQAAIPTIQWKTAFILTSTQSFVYGPLTVVLNTFGPVLLVVMSTPLILIWNIAPTSLAKHTELDQQIFRAITGTNIYATVILLSSSLTAAWLRRHLMVWKIFAPRYMLSAVLLLVIDIAGIISMMVAERVSKKVKAVFFVQMAPMKEKDQ